MNPAEPDLRDKISEIAQSVGKKFGKCLEINLSAFIKKWREEYPSIKVKKLEIATILRADFSAEDVEGDILRVQERHIAKKIQKASQEDSSRKERPNRPAKKLEKLEIQLALEVLGYLQTHLEKSKLEDSSVNFNTIHELWQVKNPNKRFKSYHVGTFKKFLTTVCELREDDSNKELFNCKKSEIVNRIRLMKGDQENTCNRDYMDASHLNEKGEDKINIAESQGIEVKPAACVLGGNRETDMLESNATKVKLATPLPSKKHEIKDTSSIASMEECAQGR